MTSVIFYGGAHVSIGGEAVFIDEEYEILCVLTILSSFCVIILIISMIFFIMMIVDAGRINDFTLFNRNYHCYW